MIVILDSDTPAAMFATQRVRRYAHGVSIALRSAVLAETRYRLLATERPN
jgi:hypothetical protein